MTAATRPLQVIDTSTADEFWGLLSPEKPLFPSPSTLLYRGQADHTWHLVPSVLRRRVCANSDNQVFTEWAWLKSFVDYCDSTGLAIPNDSPDFRNEFLNQNAPAGPGRAFIDTGKWPAPELYGLLALGQHYQLPTRLLDWSTRSYVAAYFAISDALAIPEDDAPERLAVWILDISKKSLFRELKVVQVPGSNNVNLAAQGGMFTLLEQQGTRGGPFTGEVALDLYFEAQPLLPASLMKVTLPVAEAYKALRLCNIYGVTGAALFPGYGGAVRAAENDMSRAMPLP